MKNENMERRLKGEIMSFVESRKSLMLSSLDENQDPYASYAPFAVGDECLYVLLSEIAVHGINLQINPKAAALLVQDESESEEMFARVRIHYRLEAEHIPFDKPKWSGGIEVLKAKHGERISSLSQLSDFKLFELRPRGGRYVKGFGKAYTIEGGTLAGEGLSHLRDGHKKRGKPLVS